MDDITAPDAPINQSIDRRTLLGLVAASLASGCVSCPSLGQAPAGFGFGDAHVHLFNAADLPIAGFLRFVALPELAPNMGSVWKALIDLAVTVIKPFAISAEAEQSRLFPPWREAAADDGDISPRAFADRIAARVETFTRRPKSAFAAGEEENLHDSYIAFGALLAEGRSRALGRISTLGTATEKSLDDPAVKAAASRIDRNFLARVAREGEAVPGGEMPAPKFLLDNAMLAGPTDLADEKGNDLSGLWATIQWAYEMMRPRCAHMRSYLKTIEPAGTRCDLLINLLVDYDAWLDDHPTQPTSGHNKQVAFWTRYAQAAAPRLTIKTFAGYDPLKHSEERLSGDGSASAYFEERKGWWLAGKAGMGTHQVAGFKLYPPMGFLPGENRPPSEVRSGATVRKRWADNGWDMMRFGAELDRSLDLFLAFAAGEDIPLLAHGRNSQEASPGTGAFATPDKWIARIGNAAAPLRICIAHYTVTQFEQHVPALLAAARQSGSQVYFDLAYAEEFLSGRGSAILDSLERLCVDHPEAADRFLFGSDWIMLGRDGAAGGYTRATVAAVDSHRFWQRHKDKLFQSNLRGFLKSA